MLCGDVEANPGPPKPPPGSAGRQTRQSSIYFSQNDNSNSTRNNNGEQRLSDTGSYVQTQDEMFAFLRTMKSEMDVQTDRVRQDIASIDNKIDSITSSINDLRLENEQLKQSNIELHEEMNQLKSKIDILESHSRRTNLRMNGIQGSHTESWEETEEKVRNFIAEELDLPDKRDVEIERAHRIRSGGQGSNSTIIAKFSKYKDCQNILQKANETFDRQSRFSVQQDYTDRVKRHRRELGKEMVKARESGQYATIRYDKLIINNKVYKYDDTTRTIVCVGNRFRNSTTESRDQTNRGATNTDLGGARNFPPDDSDDVIQ